MKDLKSLTTEQLVNRALATAVTLMIVWSLSIALSIFTSLKVLASLAWW